METLNTLEPLLNCGNVVSIVGAGGKTSLLYTLAGARTARGARTAVLTTTKIVAPAAYCRTAGDCLARWQDGRYAVCGEPAAEGKLAPPRAALLGWLLQTADCLLIEADGAKRRPCKAPAGHEPVILPETDAVIGVMGLDALGQTVGAICHRPERVCALLGCAPEHVLTESDLAHILLSENGTRKEVRDRPYYIVLNKCDDAARRVQGERIAALLAARGHTKTILTRLKKGEINHA